ncbi:MAG: methionyl-tRNA formyltransferase [Puniceicoccales bacterium]|jgi:methionyl-tRNA formyltransferase|nr:methionyl-tRNA formyltransferase [Puniceicoccales bacterium]
MKRIVFFGSDEIALPCLEHIAGEADVEIVAAFSQPDRPSGRGKQVRANAVVEWARQRGLPVFQPQERPGEEAAATLRELGCDVALVMAYGHILRRELLETLPLGFFNIHGSLLPALRGATPIEGAIVSGLAESGVCLQRVVSRLDAGAVLDAERVPLAPDETRLSLREKMAAASVPLIARVLPQIFSGDAAGVPQDETVATFTRKITREDSAADFHATARELAARVRALSPWPGVTIPWGGIELKIGGAFEVENTGNIASAALAVPGTILQADGRGVCVATGTGVLCLSHLQRPTAKMLPAAAFLAGMPLPIGSVFESRPMRALVAAAPFKNLDK